MLRASHRPLADRAAHARQIFDTHRSKVVRGRRVLNGRCACDLCIRALVVLSEAKTADQIDLRGTSPKKRFEILRRAVQATFMNLGYDEATIAKGLEAFERSTRKGRKRP